MTKKDLIQRQDTEELSFYGFINGVFSPWYPSRFKVDGILYYSATQYYSAKKAEYFQDIDTYKLILETPDPTEAKHLADTVKGLDKSSWFNISEKIYKESNLYKFRQNPELAQMLIDTGDSIIISCLISDHFWGAGVDIMFGYSKVKDWVGENRAGFILMDIRDILIKELNET